MKVYIVDAFTTQVFKGNPAGVCMLESSISEEKMLLIAQELGLSETAFIQKNEEKGNYAIRFFSPKMEIPLCGHATMASSKVLFQENDVEKISFINIQGIEIEVDKVSDGIKMVFPVYHTRQEEAPRRLLEALGIDEIINAEYNEETRILLLEIESKDQLMNLNPSYQTLVDSTDKYNGVCITTRSEDDGYDFYSRYFWPWSGTMEDPATGGTHTFLTPYWSKRLNKKKMVSFQLSKRTGYMEVELISDDRFTLKSDAAVVFKGFFESQVSDR